MKQFFTVLFGGLCAVLVGVGIAYGGAWGWRSLKTHLAAPQGNSTLLSLVAGASRGDPGEVAERSDGTSISGIRRTIRYTASEEEDLINAASQTLPTAAQGIGAPAYVLKNLTGGTISVQHNADQLRPIASLTKLATAVVARKLIDADERVNITREIMSTYGNTAYFTVGETFKASDLLYPLLMVSSNDAAEAFAQDYGRTQFIGAMNDWAQSIGAYRTYFADPSGLSSDNVSTANDVALMLDWIMKNDREIIDITALKSKTVRSHTWVNPTHFLSWSYYLGGKNGYTTEANRTAASLFSLGSAKNIYAAVILGSDNRDADVVKLLGKVRE